MGVATVIVSFVVCIFFNIFLNSFDVYSDIGLSLNTLTFNLGNSILLSGCRVCHGKDNQEVFKVKNNSCQHCLTKNSNFHCGASFEVLDKINELHAKETKNVCENEYFSVSLNYTTKGYVFKNDTCDDNEDVCCLHTGKDEYNPSSLERLDKRILAMRWSQFHKNLQYYYDV